MESLTYYQNLKISPKKLRFLITDVKKMSPVAAVDFLYYTPKKGARMLHSVLNSALANAKNTLKVDDDLLQFKLFTIEEGNKLKRYRAGGRGTPKPFKIKFSHVKIILVAKDAPKAEKKEVKEEAKKLEAPKKEEVKKVTKKAAPKKVVAKKA